VNWFLERAHHAAWAELLPLIALLHADVAVLSKFPAPFSAERRWCFLRPTQLLLHFVQQGPNYGNGFEAMC